MKLFFISSQTLANKLKPQAIHCYVIVWFLHLIILCMLVLSPQKNNRLPDVKTKSYTSVLCPLPRPTRPCPPLVPDWMLSSHKGTLNIRLSGLNCWCFHHSQINCRHVGTWTGNRELPLLWHTAWPWWIAAFTCPWLLLQSLSLLALRIFCKHLAGREDIHYTMLGNAYESAYIPIPYNLFLPKKRSNNVYELCKPLKI